MCRHTESVQYHNYKANNDFQMNWKCKMRMALRCMYSYIHNLDLSFWSANYFKSFQLFFCQCCKEAHNIDSCGVVHHSIFCAHSMDTLLQYCLIIDLPPASQNQRRWSPCHSLLSWQGAGALQQWSWGHSRKWFWRAALWRNSRRRCEDVLCCFLILFSHLLL